MHSIPPVAGPCFAHSPVALTKHPPAAGYTRPVSDPDSGWLRSLRWPLTGLFLANSRVAYRRLAGRLADQIADYRRSGYTVESVVVVAGSPSWGVATTAWEAASYPPRRPTTPDL